MATEKERKFLVDRALLPDEILRPKRYLNSKAAYFTSGDPAVRVSLVRTVQGNGTLTDPYAKICVKMGKGLVRQEFEYEIPYEDGQELYEACPNKISKARVYWNGWEIDFFNGKYADLVMAEYEEAEGKPTFEEITKPFWLLNEVTEDHRYTNQYLAHQND